MEKTSFDKIVEKFELNVYEVQEFEEYLSKNSMGKNADLNVIEKLYYSWILAENYV